MEKLEVVLVWEGGKVLCGYLMSDTVQIGGDSCLTVQTQERLYQHIRRHTGE